MRRTGLYFSDELVLPSAEDRPFISHIELPRSNYLLLIFTKWQKTVVEADFLLCELDVLFEGYELDSGCEMWVFSKFEKRVIGMELSEKNAKGTNIEIVLASLAPIELNQV